MTVAENSETAINPSDEKTSEQSKNTSETQRGDRAQGKGYQSQERNSFERPRVAAMEVAVDNNIEKAMKVLKRKLIKEGLFKELKSRRYYEKPSERKKRKHKESVKKVRKEEMRQKRSAFLFS